MSAPRTLLISALRSAILPTTQQLYIAYSGGVDSHVLLHVCSELIEFKGKITAVYVHHGLQAIAESWAVHCRHEAEKRGVNFQLLRVNAQPKNDESPEEAARNARYQALKPLLAENDVLLVAQHREDQLETVLLQLFRGAGIQGLSAMPKVIPFGQGLMVRPFLEISKQTIQQYAEEQQLSWVTDPTNACDDFDRNFLRNRLIPLVKMRWSQVDKTVARTAQHCAAAQELLNEAAEHLLVEILNEDNTLSISKLQQLNQQKQSLVIRHWFKRHGLNMPSSAFITAIFTEVIAAHPNRDPQLKKAGLVIRRYQNKLYCLNDLPVFKNLTEIIWQPIENQVILPDDRVLRRYPAADGIPVSVWHAANVTVRFRQGGEKIRLAGRQGHHSLKNLFQAAQIPPWQRDVIPLLYFDNQLVAVADLWLNADIQSSGNGLCYQLVWQPSA